MKLHYLGLTREALLEESKKNREVLIGKELTNIKNKIEEAVSRGLEGICYKINSEHCHVIEDLIFIIEESGLTAKESKIPAYTVGEKIFEIYISWKDESGIQLY